MRFGLCITAPAGTQSCGKRYLKGFAMLNKEQTEQERKKQIEDLLSVSTDAEKSQIEVGRHAGQQLRRELESQEPKGGK